MTSSSTYVGREQSISQLSEAIRDSSRGDGTGLICLAGVPGSGRESLLRAATERVPSTLLRPVRPPKVARQVPAKEMSPASGLVDVAVMGPVDLPAPRAHLAIAETLATVPPQPGRVLVIVTTPEAAELLAADNSSPYVATFIDSPLMDRDDLVHLAETILVGSPSPRLVDTLANRSEHMAGAAVDILRAWVSTGQIISTVRGLDVVSDSTSLDGAPCRVDHVPGARRTARAS